MLDTEKVLRYFEMQLSDEELRALHDTDDHLGTASIITPEKSIAWPKEMLPHTRYSLDTDERSSRKLSRMEALSEMELSSVKPRKLAELLNCIDILLINNLTTRDLVEYDGDNVPTPVAHLQNKNAGILGWLSHSADFRYLNRMLKQSVVLKNYNMINLLAKVAQARRLNNRQMRKIVYYKQILDSQDGGIFPFEWLLKDCSDSNVNVDSRTASLRFCRIVEKLGEMKKIAMPRRIGERVKQMIYTQAWRYLDTSPERSGSGKGMHRLLYLVL